MILAGHADFVRTMNQLPKFVLLTSLLVGCDGNRVDKSTDKGTMNPHDILFTTPTLNDALPTSLGTAVPRPDCYQMNEDDWRQFEFVSGKFGAELASEIAAIDQVWKDQSVPIGEHFAFRASHVRKAIPTPLNIPFSVEEFEELFGQKVSPITIEGYERVLDDVHAVRLENIIIYAAITDGYLTTLGLEPLAQFVLPESVIARLEVFLTTNDLRLVHWRSRTLFGTPKAATTYLRGQ